MAASAPETAPDAASVWDQHARVVEQLTERFPAAAELLAEVAPDVLAFTESAWDPRRLHTLEVRMEHGTAPFAEAVPA
jgi:hypothetical protein